MLTREQYSALKELRDSIYPYTSVQKLRDGRDALDELIREYEYSNKLHNEKQKDYLDPHYYWWEKCNRCEWWDDNWCLFNKFHCTGEYHCPHFEKKEGL